MKKPNVDLIEGLSPAISIEQKNTSKNPRSTVATVTEIYDYMRVLYARVGIPYSPFTGKKIESQTITQMVDKIKEIQKIFKIRNCSDNTFANRTRPCIEFQMKRCSAPCVQKINKVDYFEDITSAKSFLSSSDTKTIEKLTKDIKKAVSDVKGGKIDFKVDKNGIIHASIGKASFEAKKNRR